MQVLLWLAAPLAVTVLAMLWATWAGRPRQEPSQRDSDEAYERFSSAIRRPHPAAQRTATPRTVAVGRRSGVVVRRRSLGDEPMPRSPR